MKDRPEDNYNWMIRVAGMSADGAVPVTSPLPPEPFEWSSMTLEEAVKILDLRKSFRCRC
jgi:hypothetical protein